MGRVLTPRVYVSAWVAAIAVAGCSPPRATVAGRVTLDGKQLPAGRVTFLCDGKGRPAVAGAITSAGTYEIVHLPPGRATVSVETFKPQPRPAPGIDPTSGADPSLDWEDTGPYVPIPQRYANPTTSGLEYEMTPGPQTFDIQLTQ